MNIRVTAINRHSLMLDNKHWVISDFLLFIKIYLSLYSLKRK